MTLSSNEHQSNLLNRIGFVQFCDSYFVHSFVCGERWLCAWHWPMAAKALVRRYNATIMERGICFNVMKVHVAGVNLSQLNCVIKSGEYGKVNSGNRKCNAHENASSEWK